MKGNYTCYEKIKEFLGHGYGIIQTMPFKFQNGIPSGIEFLSEIVKLIKLVISGKK
jgi:hypothetical protein